MERALSRTAGYASRENPAIAAARRVELRCRPVPVPGATRPIPSFARKMPIHESRKPQGGRAALVIAIILVAGAAALAGAAYHFRSRLESEPPRIALSPDTDMLGPVPFQVEVTDGGAGLRSVTARLTQGGAEQVIASEHYAKPVPGKKFAVALTRDSPIKEGPAVLHVTARDASLWHWLAGNETVLEKNLTIDLTPPTLELVGDDRYVSFGGVGAIAYKSSPDTVTTGVKIGLDFFPGFKGVVKGHPDVYFALFAHPYNVPPNVRAVLVAADRAHNVAEMPLSYELKNVKYKESTIAVSDAFFQNKVLPLLHDASRRDGSVKEVFVAVDQGVRKENEDKIAEVTKKTTPSILWKDAFVQLSNSKVEANFADKRTYTYKGEPIDTAYHLGYDLSVTKHYAIEASNSGVVAFTGDLGLYGNAIIIDHGLGLFTLYGHCSQIDVKPGDRIEKRQIIGKTGETGFAGGDHLHFGVYLDGVPVLPVEWWDQHWIDGHITPMLEGRSGEPIAREQPAAHKAQHKAAHKRRS